MDLLEQGVDQGGVALLGGGQLRGEDLAAGGIDREVGEAMGRTAAGGTLVVADDQRSAPMPDPNGLSRCPTALEQDTTLIAVIEPSLSSWLVAGIVPGIERQPLKKLEPDPEALLRLLERWRGEAARAGPPSRAWRSPSRPAATASGWPAGCGRAASRRTSSTRPASPSRASTGGRRPTGSTPSRSSVPSSAGSAASAGTAAWPRCPRSRRRTPRGRPASARRWPASARASSAGSRPPSSAWASAASSRRGAARRGAPERLRALRTPEGVELPPNTLAEVLRDVTRLGLVREQIERIEEVRAERLREAPCEGTNAMVRLLARVAGVGVETADMLAHEVLSRDLRDGKAVARYAGLTGSPDESGARRREQGLAEAGNARVRRGMIQLAWRFLLHQKGSALARWYRARTADARAGRRKTLIVALARKLLVGLWCLVTMGKVPEGVLLRPA